MAVLAARRRHCRHSPSAVAVIGLVVILLGYLALIVWVCWWAGAEERAEYRRALRERGRY
ncbi:hypothetical protein [Pseudonocardia humida]|uniref:Uncharacterized protein n=1 Tax=Pseudonocardia humida TaxID=2800819 RepID=A0ABT1A2X1_9PSEU|nr:hypothetical protein [Pseudonocardia humida]MCO1657356.1 hypothetical protein [Pseudonocardia humida]